MEQRRITQQDVARKAGVHRSSVSMAFHNHPNIPEKTKARILRVAAKLGYSPDPMLSSLAAYRGRRRPASFHGTLAWLVNSAFGYDWQTRPHFADYHSGAESRARHHGYQLEIFDLNTPDLSLARFAGILHARSISGILLCPQPQPETVLDFPWADFAAVTFGYTLTKPQLHTVTAAQYRAAMHTMRKLQELGYRRIGLVLDEGHDRRTDHNYLAGYLIGEHLGGESSGIPPLYVAYDDYRAVSAWIKKHKPDAVITGGHQFLDTLKRIRIRVPSDIGVACPLLPSDNTILAGMVENNIRAGAVAVDYLVAMIQRGERGIPDSAERIHVETRWWPGKTLRRQRIL